MGSRYSHVTDVHNWARVFRFLNSHQRREFINQHLIVLEQEKAVATQQLSSPSQHSSSLNGEVPLVKEAQDL